MGNLIRTLIFINARAGTSICHVCRVSARHRRGDGNGKMNRNCQLNDKRKIPKKNDHWLHLFQDHTCLASKKLSSIFSEPLNKATSNSDPYKHLLSISQNISNVSVPESNFLGLSFPLGDYTFIFRAARAKAVPTDQVFNERVARYKITRRTNFIFSLDPYSRTVTSEI